jgi:hypothetical protein
LQTIIDRLAGKKKTAAAPPPVSMALDAARVLEQKQDPRTRIARYRDTAAIGAVGNPMVRSIGSAVEAGLKAPKGKRLASAGRAALTARPVLARQAVEGALGGGGIRALQEGREIQRAHHTVRNFLGADAQKTAMLAVMASAEMQDKLAAEFKGIAPLPAKVRNQKLPPVSAPDFDFEVE